MKKICISQNWRFSDALTYWWRDSQEIATVDLPHDYAIGHPRSNNAPGRFGNGYFNGGYGRYSKFINFETKEHTILDIDGAYMCAEIRLNKDLLAIHPHGYTPFLLDLTDKIVWGAPNKLEIHTNDIQPSSRWYAGAGLYRDVFLWTGGKVRIEPWDLYVVTNKADEKCAHITVKTQIASDINTHAILKITIYDKDGNAAVSHCGEYSVNKDSKTNADIDFEIINPYLWDTENAFLYKINVEIQVNGEITDTYEQTFGIREIRFSPEYGMTLNGKPIKLRGGCIHHDHGALGVCAYPAAEERKIKKLKSVGFNALRTAHNPPSTAFMEICDREGILVMDEAFDVWNCGKRANDYHLWFESWWARDISYMVMRDRSHPCIISYSIGNEIFEANGRSDGAMWSKKLCEEVRKYDTSRPVTAAVCNNWESWDAEAPAAPEEYREIFFKGRSDLGNRGEEPDSQWDEWTAEYIKPLDIVGYNYLYQRYAIDGKKYPNRIIWGSETHALNIYHSWKAVMENNHVIGDFTWTAYDNLGEAGTGRWQWGGSEKLPLSVDEYPWRCCWQGDFDLAGFRRPQSYFRESVWRKNTVPKIFTTHPKHNGQVFGGTGWHWYDVNESWTFDDQYIGEPVKTEVYTCADEVRFVLNGKVVGLSSPVDGIASVQIPYEKGELRAEAITDGVVTGTSSLVTAGEKAVIKVCPEKSEFKADGRDLCYFEIHILDRQGNAVPYDKSVLRASVSGAELLCIFSGDPKNEDQYTSDTCHAFNGRAVAVVKTKNKGDVTITVSGDGLESDTQKVSAV